MRWNPHAYQKKAMRFCVERGAAGLFLDPGLGKTSISYGTFRALRRAGMVERMLVIAPLRPATSTWPREAQKWDDFRELNVHVLHGPDKQALLEQPHDVSIINPEGLQWLLGYTDDKGRKHKGAAQEAGVWWDLLVVDESTKFKNTQSKRFRILRPNLPRFHRRVILTGSPAPNGLMDLFGQVFILDFGRSLGEYITRFRNKYFDSAGFGGFDWKIKEGADKAIYKAIKPYVLRMAAADLLELPPLTFNDIHIPLPEKARKAYDQMENLLLAELEAGLITAANSAVATGKCRQIANGGLFLDAEHNVEHIHDAKTEALQDLVEELGGRPLLVGYEFSHDLARLRRAFPKAPFIGGGVSTKRARELEDQWNAGMLPVLFAQPQSVAHGLNLQGTAGHVAFYSVPWDLEVYEQFIRRVWRQGQKERVVVHRLLAESTVDDIVIRALAKKDRTQRDLFAALSAVVRSRARASAADVKKAKAKKAARARGAGKARARGAA